MIAVAIHHTLIYALIIDSCYIPNVVTISMNIYLIINDYNDSLYLSYYIFIKRRTYLISIFKESFRIIRISDISKYNILKHWIK